MSSRTCSSYMLVYLYFIMVCSSDPPVLGTYSDSIACTHASHKHYRVHASHTQCSSCTGHSYALCVIKRYHCRTELCSISSYHYSVIRTCHHAVAILKEACLTWRTVHRAGEALYSRHVIIACTAVQCVPMHASSYSS